MTMQPLHLVDVERFWSKVDQSGGPRACWPWLGPLDRYGYGEYQKRFGGGPSMTSHYWRAHRVAYELLVSRIPDGLILDHLCRVRHCTNPAHMEPVTNAENRRRSRGYPPQGIFRRRKAS